MKSKTDKTLKINQLAINSLIINQLYVKKTNMCKSIWKFQKSFVPLWYSSSVSNF